MTTETKPTTAVEVFDRYIAAWASTDPDAIAALHATDGSFHLHAGEAPAVGRAAIRARFAGIFAQWPEFGFDVHRALIGEGHWVLDWAMTAVLRAPDGSRRPVRIELMDVVEFDPANGLVTSKDTYLDYQAAQDALAV
jgi:steroid delta-isomerase-like uncharacterized protein